MTVYLHDIPLDQALSRLDQALMEYGIDGILGQEELPLSPSLVGRVLAEPIWAKISSPHYHSSAMDGFALKAKSTRGATLVKPITLEFGSETIYLDTGDPLPTWANAVIPIENVEPLDENDQPAQDPRKPNKIRIREASRPWHHVRSMGEDMVATELVLASGHVLRPVDLGAIAGCGHHSVVVSKKPSVGVIPTGTELVEIGKPVEAGDIIEYNSLVLASQIEEWGGQATRYPITKDDFELIKNRVAEAAESHDLILLNAGSSAGAEDFSAAVVDSLGELLVHGVAVRPGHPVIIGVIHRHGRDVPIIGVPGYPVSAALTGEIFVEGLISRWLGRQPKKPEIISANLTRKITSPAGDDDYVRVAVGSVNERTLAAPLSRGSGVITSLVRADGIMVIPSGSQGFPAGEKVDVWMYRSMSDIQQTIFSIGSHDMILDVMAQSLAGDDRRLISSNVGSLGGLIALKRQEAHLAGSHLIDPQTGEYNLSYIRKYIPEIPVELVTLVHRQQGLIVKQGNPKGIQKLEDLTREDVNFINRQTGAGTRVLLDYQLELMDIKPDQVHGYDQEEYTHLSVAAAVASGRADCGLGIAAAANALELAFIPLFKERYDLVIPKIYLESDLMSPLVELLNNQDFREIVSVLPGYDITEMGNIVHQPG